MPNCGDLVEVTCNHPVLGDYKFFAKADEDHSYDLGGIRNADEKQNVDGGGRNIKKMTRGRWSVEFVPSWDATGDAKTNELQALADLAASPNDGTWTFASLNGSVYQGLGSPVGDFVGKGTDGTIDSVKIAGGGVLKKIAA